MKGLISITFSQHADLAEMSRTATRGCVTVSVTRRLPERKAVEWRSDLHMDSICKSDLIMEYHFYRTLCDDMTLMWSQTQWFQHQVSGTSVHPTCWAAGTLRNVISTPLKGVNIFTETSSDFKLRTENTFTWTPQNFFILHTEHNCGEATESRNNK